MNVFYIQSLNSIIKKRGTFSPHQSDNFVRIDDIHPQHKETSIKFWLKFFWKKIFTSIIQKVASLIIKKSKVTFNPLAFYSSNKNFVHKCQNQFPDRNYDGNHLRKSKSRRKFVVKIKSKWKVSARKEASSDDCQQFISTSFDLYKRDRQSSIMLIIMGIYIRYYLVPKETLIDENANKCWCFSTIVSKMYIKIGYRVMK